ncbi:MAG: cation:proton antiporter [Clostridium sp.]|nr:cation:proton antiporter [Prevotella sp.]MCM1378132.1 cation:proton antiporter [Prevotella sp.]MCM1428934.1 cation:proton antiporter [Clostridium sp.]
MHLPLSQPVAIFLLVLVIILCTPLLFRRMKIPYIVGLILAGVAVGPYGFNLLDRDASFRIFGQVGILYLMFLASIEIDMYHLRRNVRPGLVFGLLTFLIPMGLGVCVMRLAFDASWSTAVIVASMFSSHTLVSYPVVSGFGISNSRGAVIAVCATIVAVLLSLLALAEVIDVTVSGGFSAVNLLKMTGLMVIYAIVVSWTYPKLTRWFFRKFNDSVEQFIFILALVFLASLLASFIGLESILGAFFAGLVLNRFIPRRSALMRNIQFVGNAVFIPYFLIGVGMLINVHVVFRGWGVLYTAGIMILTAMSTKWIAAYAAAGIYRLNNLQRSLMFGLSSGKAAATIAATIIGYQYNLLSEDMMNGAVIMILVCCIIASVSTERAAKKIKMEEQDAFLRSEDHFSPGFARQVVAVSNPMTAEGIMQMAVFMRNPDNEEPISAVYVCDSETSKATAIGRNALNIASRTATGMGVEVRESERFDLNIVAGLTNTMKERRATEIVIGLHRRGNIVDSFFGSMTEGLLRNTDRMVILSRCFIPVDTIRKLVVFVPKNAEYEPGFHAMLARVGNLSSQLSCRSVFICYAATEEHIEKFYADEDFSFRRSYRQMESWDDFIILSSQAGDEDLLIVVGSRKDSLSYSSDMDNMPSFLAHHFSRNNITMIYPSQLIGIRN